MNLDISDTAIDELKQAIGGTVWRHGDAGFVRHSQLFNTTIRSSAKLLVRPLDARDVSETIKFCARHNLSPSVKSGGYGTHGWAVEGDVIIDMRLIAQVTIERPLEDVEGPDWISMKETPHKAVKDPDILKGKNRVSSTGFPSADPATVGPPPIHGPFTHHPQRRSADEAFDKIVVVPPQGGMDGEGAGQDLDSDRPMRRLRVTSTASGHTAGSSELTPSTTWSPHTPADGIDLPKPEPFSKRPFSFDDPPPVTSGKGLGPVTPNEIVHDEGMLPPSSERPAVGVDIRGFVGRNPGGWDVTWDGGLGRAPTEPMGPTIPSPPAPAFRSTAPSSARPFDFADSTPVAEVNALANPHGNPGGTTLFPGLGGARMPFQFMTPEGVSTPDNSARSSSNTSTPGLVSTPNASSTSSHGARMTTSPQPYAAEPSTSAPTITHLAFEPTAPVSHTYVTFGAGASQKDINGFCAAHPLEALVPGGGGEDDPESTPKKKPTLVADSAQPDLYKPPQSTGFGSFFPPGAGTGAGSFFPPGAGAGAGSLFGQSNSIFGRPPSAPAIPYYVPFAAHPVGSSVMLLGGFGFMSRLRGLSMDCLVEAEVVLADGRIVWVSEGGVRDENGDEVEVGEGDEVDVLAEEFLEGERARAQKAKGKEKDDGTGDGDDKSAFEPDSDDNADPEDPPKKRGLWWALRGAGSAFGLVIRYKAKAFPVPVVFAGNLIYNFNKLTAGSLIKHFRDCIKAAPRELYANCILTAGPKNKGALVVIQICYAGTRADGLPFLQAISSWEGEGCLLNEVQEKEFVWQQDSIAKVLKGGSGRKWFIRSDLISSLTDEIIHRTVKSFSDTPDGCTWLFELAGGALADTTDSCLPKAAREAAFTIVALHQWKLEFNDPACVLTAEEWIKNTLGPVSTGGPFPCFLERRETRARVLGSYGAQNWARLCALKRKYDPHGMFKHNFWPLDEHGKPIVDPREMRSGANQTSGHAMDLTLDDNGVPI